jgi:hypothetical protein
LNNASFLPLFSLESGCLRQDDGKLGSGFHGFEQLGIVARRRSAPNSDPANGFRQRLARLENRAPD